MPLSWARESPSPISMAISRARATVSFSFARRFFEPIQDDVHLQRAVRFDRLGHDEAAVRRYIVVGAANSVAQLVPSFEQHDGRAQRRACFHTDGHQFVSAAVEELATISCPHRLVAPIGRDDLFAVESRKPCQVDVFPSCLVWIRRRASGRSVRSPRCAHRIPTPRVARARGRP